MSNSLLAHLYPHIRGSHEDIATYSLQYLLSQSNELNKNFTKRLSAVLHISTEDMLQYVCQVTGQGDERERPDMAGLDTKGNEVVLCEMKFYATLTANQPLTYLERLEKNGGKGLLFVCPSVRQTNLWAKLKELCGGSSVEQIDEHCIVVNGVNLAIITWTEIIELLKEVSSSVALEFLADVKQLEGYCNQIDSEAFIPFTAEDLSAEMANKGERYYQIVDEVIELFCADEKFSTSTKGVKATGFRKGYAKSLAINNMWINFNYNRDMWKNPRCVETPFWVSIRNDDWGQDDDLIKKHDVFHENKKQMGWGYIYLALEAPQNAIFSEVCEDIKMQIEKYIEVLK